MTDDPGSWPRGRPRVLVTDAWLANSGDGAIALALDRLVRSVRPTAAVLHAAYQWDLLGREHLPELAFVPPLDALLGVDGAAPLPAGWTVAAGEALVRGADLVVSQGGGFLLEHYQPWPRLFAHARAVELGARFGLLGQTIGFFRAARARALLRRNLGAARAVSVRDRPSLENAIELGADPARVLLTSDLALLGFPAPPEEPSASGEGIAVVLSDHPQNGGAGRDPASLAGPILAEVLERTGDEAVTLLSTVQGLGEHGLEDDGEVAAAAVETLDPARRRRVRLLDGFLGPHDAIAALSRHRAVVTQRLHPALFALSSGVPAAILTDADKIGTLDGVDLGPARCTRPADRGARGAALDAVLAPEAPRGSRLWEALAPARERALENGNALAGLLADPAR